MKLPTLIQAKALIVGKAPLLSTQSALSHLSFSLPQRHCPLQAQQDQKLKVWGICQRCRGSPGRLSQLRWPLRHKGGHSHAYLVRNGNLHNAFPHQDVLTTCVRPFQIYQGLHVIRYSHPYLINFQPRPS